VEEKYGFETNELSEALEFKKCRDKNIRFLQKDYLLQNAKKQKLK
jgi:hypothetical protein